MRIKNVAIFGIMAAIINASISVAYADGTVIASQAYVDAKDNLKQNKLKTGSGGNVSVDNTATTTASRAITGVTATGDGTVTFTTEAIQTNTATDFVTDTQGTGANAVDNVANFTDDSTHAPSITATKKGLNTKQAKLGGTVNNESTAGKVVTATATAGTVSYTGTTDSNVVATATESTDLLKAKGLQTAVIHMKGTGAANYIANVDNTDTANTGIQNETVASNAKTAWNNALTAKKGDDLLPTLATVERRVQEAEAYADSAASTAASGVAVEKTDTKSATYDSTEHTLTVATSGDGASTTKVATPKQVGNTVTDVKSYIDYKASGDLARKSAVGSSDITDNSIMNADVNSNANIASTKLQVGTRYTKQSGNIATSDTVQTALGKLEQKADDAKNTADGINNKIAVQGDYTTGWWNTDVVNTTNDKTNNSNLGDATSSNKNKDTYIPTVKAVEMYFQSLIESGATDPTFYAAYDAWVHNGRKTSGGDWDALQGLITHNGDNTHNVVSDYAEGHQQIIPRNRNIQNGIAYLKGNGIEHYTEGVQNSDTADIGLLNRNVQQAADAAWGTNIDNKNGAADDYVPTVASVERRVQLAEERIPTGDLASLNAVGSSQITNNSIMDDDVNSSAGIKATKLKVNTGYTTTGVSGNVAVDDTVQQALAKIEKKADDAATAATNAVTTLDDTASLTASSSDGTWTLNTAGTAGNKTDEAATTHAVAATATQIKNYVDYKASGSLARKSAVGSSEITDDSIVNADINSNANIAFSKMDSSLNAIDSTSEANCTPNLPCMLTFYKIGNTKYYKWTSLDLESTNDHAVPNS